jgi:hypothetical protein
LKLRFIDEGSTILVGEAGAGPPAVAGAYIPAGALM